MLQEILALILIGYFLFKLFWQKKAKKISANEFIFWFGFWMLSGVSILFVRYLDVVAVKLGFSSSGIELLVYLSVMVLFYLIFKTRLKLEKIEKSMTKLVEEIAIREAKKN